MFIKEIILFLILFSTFSCISTPEIDTSTDDANVWINKVRDKYSIDSFENLYRFKKNGNLDIFIYGYKEPIKYILYRVEGNIAFYYSKLSIKNFIINNVSIFNLYNLDIVKNPYDLLDKQIDFASIKSFKDRNIYIISAFEIKDNNLYIISERNEDYNNKVTIWKNKNGYIGMNTNWHPHNNADWNSYPIPNADDLNLNIKYKINVLYDM